jgi:hypothetical protein
MYITLISVSVAAALIVIFIPLLRYASFFHFFLGAGARSLWSPRPRFLDFFSRVVPVAHGRCWLSSSPSVSLPVLLGFPPLFFRFLLSSCYRCSWALLVFALPLWLVPSLLCSASLSRHHVPPLVLLLLVHLAALVVRLCLFSTIFYCFLFILTHTAFAL